MKGKVYGGSLGLGRKASKFLIEPDLKEPPGSCFSVTSCRALSWRSPAPSVVTASLWRGRPRSPTGGRWPHKMTQALQCRACASTVLWEKPVLGLMTTRERYQEPNRRFRLQHSVLFHHRTDYHLGTPSDTRLFPSTVLTTSLPLPPYVPQQEQTPNSQ